MSLSSNSKETRTQLMMSGSMEETPSHFFKVIVASTIEDKKLMIPHKFVGKFGDELSSVATLTNPNGYVSRVGITRYEEKIWFQDGWNEFVGYHSICVGFFVVFQYRKNSNFKVSIYDTSTVEIQYPLRYMFTPSKHNRGILDSSKSNKGCELHSKTCRMEEEEVEVKDESENVADSMQDIIGMSHSQGFVHRKIHLGEIPCPLVQETDLKINSPKFKKAKQNVEDEAGTLDGNKFIALLEDMGIYICESKKSLSVEVDRQRAIDAARLFKPKNPSFLVVLRSSNMQTYYVYMPATFARKYMTGDECVLVQDSNGSKLAVTMKLYNGNYRLTGWAKFFKEKNIKEGDILFFEMIKMKDILLKVSVFYA